MIVYLLLTINLCANTFERSEELPTISTTNTDFIKDVNSIFLYITKLNANKITTTGTLELNRDGYSTTLDLPISKKDFELFPKKSFNAYVYIINHEATISNFQIYFTDSLRRITAKGNNLNDVVATLNIAKEKLLKYEVSFTGVDFRLILYFLFFLAYAVITYFLARKYSNKIYFAILIPFSIAFYSIPYIIEWKDYFPGFLSATNPMTFLEIWSPAIGLIALILAILFYILPLKK